MGQVSNDDEREIRAARNQSLFRTVNEKLEEINVAFALATEAFAISCECADAMCVETITIGANEYRAIRESPRTFAVLPGHDVPDFEDVVRGTDRYLVVEKIGTAGRVAEELSLRDSAVV